MWFQPALFPFKRKKQPDYEAQTGLVERIINKAFPQKNQKVEVLVSVTEMLDIRANKHLAGYKIPETQTWILYSGLLENYFHKCSTVLSVT